MDQANAVLGAAKQSTPCIMAARRFVVHEGENAVDQIDVSAEIYSCKHITDAGLCDLLEMLRHRRPTPSGSLCTQPQYVVI